MSEIQTIKPVATKVTDDIICNVCGNSCKAHDFEMDNGEIEKVFSCIEIKKRWGYFSNNKDLMYWEAHICEACVDKYLTSIIKFDKYWYNLATGSINRNEKIEP